MDASPETKESFMKILDCMTGADGGVAFVKFRFLIEDFDRLALNGNEHAKRALESLKTVSRMIDCAGATRY